ncbi:hypothetical protein ACUXCC_000154 [Cytobacillus horneckiae]|uniref:Uncharacterized protein n=1 Tax=Cytobacillus horneckiae TaxID=549687 RepID=A0A2N0ZG04_9BACI|nr:hypothetical protein CWS20_14625 [Cytobacillus horneckiae]
MQLVARFFFMLLVIIDIAILYKIIFILPLIVHLDNCIFFYMMNDLVGRSCCRLGGPDNPALTASLFNY